MITAVSDDVPEGPPSKNRNRRVIHTTCRVHGSCRGFTNLVMTKRDGEIELDVHVDGSCVLLLDETAATAMHDVLGQWL